MSDLTFERGDYVRKKSGAFWEGDVVGDYSTDQTEQGVNVRLFGWKDGPVQIYPASALEHVSPAHGRLAEARDKALEEAAKVAENPITYRFDDGSPPRRQPLPSGLAIAAGIRALKEKP